MALLELKGVSKGYGSPVLKRLDLGPGRRVPGGARLLRHRQDHADQPSRRAGTADAGEVLFRGAPVTGPGPERGLVFQSYALMPWLTVAGNIALAVDAVSKGTKAERAALVTKYIQMVGLAHAADRRPAELSGGMRQRVAVARALAMEPQVLLMDEPLSALDALTRANVASEIEAIWAAEKRTVVLVTNDVDEALVLADRILCLNPDGTLGAMFKVDLARPRDRGAMNDDPAFKSLRADVTAYTDGRRHQGQGRRLSPAACGHPPPRAAARLCRGGEKRDRRPLPAVFAASQGLRHAQGAIDGGQGFQPDPEARRVHQPDRPFRLRQVHGPDHGRGAERDLEGRIKLDGLHVEGADPERAVVFQSPSLFPWLTARENVAIGVDRVYPRATQAERQDVVEYYLERVGLADAMHKPAAELSNGMKQRVGIARAFALSPKLLLLDEPFGMLDSLTRWELQEVLMEVWSRTQVTAICVTHDVDEAILLADRVVMMTNGPEATIGKVTEVRLPRPRTRRALLDHPDYWHYRAEVLEFLEDYEHGLKKKEAA
jgi:nitrate/nitrite transport system ATP-binding protein